MSAFYIVLIRGIGAASHALITMKQLEAAVVAAGVGEAKSVLATGNFVVKSSLSAEEVERCFKKEMRNKGLERPVVMRSPEQLQRVFDAGAELPEVLARPQQMLVEFHQKPLRDTTVAEINAAAPVERAFILADELIIDYVGGIGTSKLTLDFLERCAGSSGTARNWNTLGKILAAAKAMGWKT